MPRFGIMTAPMQVDYDDVLRVWREADAIEEIEHAWLFVHLLPIGGDPNGPIYEGSTVLSALAARTERLRLGLLVTTARRSTPASSTSSSQCRRPTRPVSHGGSRMNSSRCGGEPLDPRAVRPRERDGRSRRDRPLLRPLQ